MRTSYWIVPDPNGERSFNVRARTKSEAQRMASERGYNNWRDARLVTVEYESIRDLIDKCAGSGGCYWEV